MDMELAQAIATDPNETPGRRMAARSMLAKAGMVWGDPYVDGNLEAAATPIADDPVLRVQQLIADRVARDAARVREKQDARIQQQLAMEQDYNDMRAERGAPMAGSLTPTQMVDGVEVPVIKGGGGRQMYSLGDVKAAQAAQREAARLAGVQWMNRRDEEQFGYGSDSPTIEQLAARANARLESVSRANDPRAVTRRVKELAMRMGVSEAVAKAAYDNAVQGLAGKGGGPLSLANVAQATDAARIELSGMEGVVDKRMAQKANARDILTRRAQAAYNPLEYLNREDVDPWSKMVLARKLVGSSGFTPIEMQARQNEGLQRLGERYLQGGGGKPLDPAQAAAMDAARRAQENQLPPEQQADLHVNDEAVHPSEMAAAEDYVSQRYSSSMGSFGTTSHFTIAEQQATIDYLVNVKKYSLEKAQRIVDDIAKKRSGQSLSNWLFGQVPMEEAAPRVPRVPEHQSM
jgi:hypothetical protein